MPRTDRDEKKDVEKHPNQTHAQGAQQRNERDRAASRRDNNRMQDHPERQERSHTAQ